MLKGSLNSSFSFHKILCVLALFLITAEASHGNASSLGNLVQKHERTRLIETEFGEISAVKLRDGTGGSHHLHFITLEPNSLFLPVLLHADMVFYVHTGSGILRWTDDDKLRKVNIRKGDVYRLRPETVFYVQSSLETEREKLRIYAIFSSEEDSINEPWTGAYSSITDLVLGFDSNVLQAAFQVPEDVIEEVMKAIKPPAIIHALQKEETGGEWQARFLKAFLGSDRDGFDSINSQNKRTKAYNILEANPDFRNCHGWSLTLDRHDLRLLRDSEVGVFMVNLTKGSMMGPHWNPRASEIAIVLQGQGMVRVVCPGNVKESECKSMRFRVKEGDVFAVRRFHPMAQMAFNNDSFVFMGFSTSTKRNYPQFLAGKSSVLQLLDRQILAVSLNVTNTTIKQLLNPQKESVILDCTSCAEEEESIMEEEIQREKEKEEEAKKRQEEEARRREEEEARRREEEEEARRREEEEEAKKREEEEEARRREEEEEARKEEEEEEARRREEEEARRREEEARKREEEEEEEEARRREEEEARRREEEEARRREEEARKREEEEEEEEARRQEEERERRARQEKGEEKERRREERRRREEAAAREQEEAKRQEKERQRRAEQEEEQARKEREMEPREPEEPETDEGGDEGERRVLKKVWKI